MTAPFRSLSFTAVLWDVQPMGSVFSAWHSLAPLSVQPVTKFTRLLSLTKPVPHFQLPFVPSHCSSTVLRPQLCLLIPCPPLCFQLFYSCFTHEDSCRLVKKATLLLSFFGFMKLITTFLWMSGATSSL